MLTININYNYVFMISILIIGIILFSVSWDIDNILQKSNCKSSSLKTSNKIVLCISVALIVSSLSFFKCSSQKNTPFNLENLNLYIMIMFLFGFTLIVLGSIISNQSVNECVNLYNTSTVWGLGVFIVLFSGGLLAYKKSAKQIYIPI